MYTCYIIYIHTQYIFKFTSSSHGQTDHPTFGVAIARTRKRFWHPLLTSKPATMTQSAPTTIPPYQP